MIIFAIEHIFRVFNSPEIEETTTLNGLLITIQYFINRLNYQKIVTNFNFDIIIRKERKITINCQQPKVSRSYI